MRKQAVDALCQLRCFISSCFFLFFLDLREGLFSRRCQLLCRCRAKRCLYLLSCSLPSFCPTSLQITISRCAPAFFVALSQCMLPIRFVIHLTMLLVMRLMYCTSMPPAWHGALALRGLILCAVLARTLDGHGQRSQDWWAPWGSIQGSGRVRVLERLG